MKLTTKGLGRGYKKKKEPENLPGPLFVWACIERLHAGGIWNAVTV